VFEQATTGPISDGAILRLVERGTQLRPANRIQTPDHRSFPSTNNSRIGAGRREEHILYFLRDGLLAWVGGCASTLVIGPSPALPAYGLVSHSHAGRTWTLAPSREMLSL